MATKDSSNISGAIDRIRSGFYGELSGARGSAKMGSLPFAPDPSGTAYVPPTQEQKTPEILQGGINLVGGILRGVTSLGRASTNLANDVLPYANRIWDLGKDGIQANEIGDVLGNIVGGSVGALQGATKGLLYSFTDPTEETRQSLQRFFGGKEPIEMGYDLFQGEDFKKAAENIPLLRGATDEKKIGEIGVPFTEWSFDVTPSGLWGFGWDVLTDPFSFATMGLGGAAKGLGRGVAVATRAAPIKARAKAAGEAAKVTDIPATDIPRPFYSYGDKSEKLAKAGVSYNVLNTSVPGYIMREMGRGFVESHKRALLAAGSRRAAKAAKQGITVQLGKRIAEATEKNAGVPPTEAEILAEFLPAIRQEAITGAKEKLKNLGASNESNLQTLLARVDGQVAEATRAVLRDDLPLLVDTLATNAAKVAARAASDNVPYIKAAEYELADAFARQVAPPVPAVTRLKPSKYDTDKLTNLASFIRQSADPRTGTGNFGKAWDEFAAEADTETLRGALESLISPLGYRTAARRAGLSETKEVKEAVTGTKRARTVTKARVSEELKEMKKRLRMRVEDLEGGKSEAVAKAGRKGRALSDSEISESPRNILGGLAREILGADAVPTDEFAKRLLEDPSIVTGEMLAKSVDQPALAAERLAYLAERDVASPTERFMLMQHLSKQGYNPLTAQVATPKLRQFATTAEEIKAAKGDRVGTTTLSEAVSLAVRASGKYIPEELGSVLTKLGVKSDVLDSVDSAGAVEEVIHAAYTRKQAQKVQSELRRLLNQRYGAVEAADLMKQTDADIPEELLREAELKASKAFRLTDQEIDKAIEMAGEMKDAQIAAINKLEDLGLSANSLAGRVLIETLGARETAAISAKRAGAREGTEVSRELRQLRIIKEELRAPAVEGQVPLRPIFTNVLDNIKKKFAKDAPEASVRELSKELTTIINKELAKAATGGSPRIRAIFALLGNTVKRYEDTMGRGTVAGFDFTFTRRAGEYDTNGVASFIARAYAGSASKNSIDNRAFADYIDSLLQGKNAKPLAEIKTHADRTKVAKSIVSEYGGEGISPAVLIQAIRAAENVGTKGGEKLSNSTAFQSDVNLIIGNFYKNMEDELIESGRLTPPSGSVGWIDRLPAESEKVAARETISQFEIQLPEQMVLNFNKKLSEVAKAQPENYKAIAAAIGGRRLEGVASFKQVAALEALYTKSSIPLDGQFKRVIDYVVGRANEGAVAAITRQRANTLVKELAPNMISKTEILRMADKVGRRENAYDAMRARFMLSTMVLKADIESTLADRAVSVTARLQGEKNLTGLKKEQERLTGLLADVDKKFAKQFPEYKEPVADRSFEEVLALDNPRAVIAKIKQMKVDTAADQTQWQYAMQHLQNMTVLGKPGAYRTYKELVDSYKDGVELSPGDINPATGKPVPTDADVLESLRLLGGDIGTRAEKLAEKGEKVTRRGVMDLLNRAEKRITEEELKRLKGNDYIRQINIAGGDAVREAATELPDPKVIKENAVETLLQFQLDLQSQGLGWIPTLAARGVGGSVKQFFTDRFKFLKFEVRDKLGRVMDADAPTLQEADTVIKRSWENYTTYTGEKRIISALADMAESKFPNWQSDAAELAKRAAWMDKHAMLTFRFRDAYLLARGIVPQKTLSLKNEAVSARIGSVFKDGEGGPTNVVSVYLTDTDVLDLMPSEIRQSMFWSGRQVAFPFTALLPAARMLVAGIDDLPAGSWFNKEQLEALAGAMAESTVREVYSSSVSQFSKVSLAKLDEKATADMVTTLTRYMLEPSNAMKLYDQHILNATIALKLLKYEADQIADPIFSAWRQVVDSPISASGDKMQATIDAFEGLRGVLGQDDLAPEAVRAMAALDMEVAFANEIDLDSFISLQEARRIANAGTTKESRKALKGEAKRIAEIQKQSRPGSKEYQTEVSNALMETMEARTKMVENIYTMQLANLVNNGPKLSVDEQFDVFNEVFTNAAFYNHTLSFADKWLERFFYDYKMENLRNIYGGIEREVLEESEEYTNIVMRAARRWQEVEAGTGINYPSMAFKVLQQIPEDELPKMMLNADIMMKAIQTKSRGVDVDLPPAAVKEMFDYAENLRQYFPEDDPQLLEAAVDLWSAGGHLFGGGEMSKIARSGLPPRWINMQIRMFGSSEAKEAISEAGDIIRVKDGFGFDPKAETAGSLNSIWREWDIENPFQMFVGLNGALSRGSKVPYAASEVMRTYGTKMSSFRQAGESTAEMMARAKEAGLVRITSQQKLTPGRELVFFMDTDNMLYPKEIAMELGTFSKFLTEPYRGWEGLQKIVRSSRWQDVQNLAKQAMTILRPGNWLMNFNGGVWTNFMFGVNSPVPYARALKMFQYGAIDVKKIGLDPKSLQGEMVAYFGRRADDGLVIKEANNPLTSDTMEIVINGKATNISYADLWELYKRIGARVPTAQSKEYDLLGELGTVEAFGRGLSARKLSTIYNKSLYRLGRWAAVRDDYLRATLWIDELSKNSWKDLESAGKTALKKIDRAHPQMQDLSKFNSNVMRQLMLFFTWRAKTFGWIMHDILDKPARIVVPLKAQYNFEQMQGDEPEYFGSFDVKGMPIRSYQQGGMDLTTPDNQYSFSLANPVTDLLGVGGWLSGISYNSYDSMATLGITSSLKTIDNFLYASTPLVATAILDWGQGRTSSGIDLTRNGVSASQDLPLLVEDALGQLGWGPAHIVLAQVAPDIFRRASWEGESLSQTEKDAIRTVVSWATGIRPRRLDSPENRQKALQEIFSKISELQKENMPD